MTHHSLDLTAFRFENDGPAAAHHPVPEAKPVRWSMLISFLAYFLTFSGIAGVLFTLAEMGGR